jgi:hypothetical protein
MCIKTSYCSFSLLWIILAALLVGCGEVAGRTRCDFLPFCGFNERHRFREHHLGTEGRIGRSLKADRK